MEENFPERLYNFSLTHPQYTWIHIRRLMSINEEDVLKETL
mgnify:CR=1 FL=1